MTLLKISIVWKDIMKAMVLKTKRFKIIKLLKLCYLYQKTETLF